MSTIFYAITAQDEESFNSIGFSCYNCHYEVNFDIIGKKETTIPFMLELVGSPKSKITIHFSIATCSKCGFPVGHGLIHWKNNEYLVIPILPPMENDTYYNITLRKLLLDILYQKHLDML